MKTELSLRPVFRNTFPR